MRIRAAQAAGAAQRSPGWLLQAARIVAKSTGPREDPVLRCAAHAACRMLQLSIDGIGRGTDDTIETPKGPGLTRSRLSGEIHIYTVKPT